MRVSEENLWFRATPLGNEARNSRGIDVHDGGNDNGDKSGISKGKGKGGTDDHDDNKGGISKCKGGNDDKTMTMMMTTTIIL